MKLTRKLSNFWKRFRKLIRLCDRWLGKLVKLLRPHHYPCLRSRPYTPEHNLTPPGLAMETETATVHLETDQETGSETETINRSPKRATLVKKLLDEAWELGHQTYPALMSYVEQQTGESCSRKTIAAWKKSRTAA